jgi:asparagine synthase (glutamine-hydrolysing)
MCGITGIYAFKEPECVWDKKDLDKMVSAIGHRGPDGSGIYCEPGIFLGHSRLAVLDLSDAGRQPMFSHNNQFVITYNGETYNFKEIQQFLKKRGVHFYSNSDTEVLVNAWQEWGVKCLDIIDGIYAFAIYDRETKELFLVRDHMGIKPLFYYSTSDIIAFASEPLSIFSSIFECPAFNVKDIDTYFTFNYIPAPGTGLKNVYQLEAGHYLKINHQGVNKKSYWSMDYQESAKAFTEERVYEFKEEVNKAIQSQLISDAPLGIFLSGGLDSFLIASSIGSIEKLSAFTLGFSNPSFNELPAASEYARKLKMNHLFSFFKWDEDIILKSLDAMKELLADASCFPFFQLSRFAKNNVKVVLSGDGGDELLAGYNTYKAGNFTQYLHYLPHSILQNIALLSQFFSSNKKRYGMRMIVQRLIAASMEPKGRDHASFRRILSDKMKNAIYKKDFKEHIIDSDPIHLYASLINQAPLQRSYLNARLYADLKFHLPAILAKVDRMSMACGLEVRVPLLSKNVIHFCINLSDQCKLSKGKGKHILRSAVINDIPKEALKRAKAGFLPPVDEWFRYPGPMNTVFGDMLYTAKSKFYMLNWFEIEQIWDKHKSGKIDAGFILLGILQFINWRIKCQKLI